MGEFGERFSRIIRSRLGLGRNSPIRPAPLSQIKQDLHQVNVMHQAGVLNEVEAEEARQRVASKIISDPNINLNDLSALTSQQLKDFLERGKASYGFSDDVLGGIQTAYNLRKESEQQNSTSHLTRRQWFQLGLGAAGAVGVSTLLVCAFPQKPREVPVPTPLPTTPLQPTRLIVATSTSIPPSPTAKPTFTQAPPSFTPTRPATETPNPTLTSTLKPTEAPTATQIPPSPTSDISPGKVLYEADWANDPNGWLETEDWVHSNGFFRNNGKGDIQRPLLAPFKVPTSNYRVEAKIKLVRKGAYLGYPSLGVVLRRDQKKNEQGYFGGFWGDGNIALIGGSRGIERVYAAVSRPFNPGNQDRIYRLDAVGNQISLFINGSPVVDLSSNSFLKGVEAGIWADNSQVDVSSFKITAL